MPDLHSRTAARTVRHVLLLSAALVGTAQAAVIYSNLPAVLPPNLASVGYEANSTTEFGDHVQFAGTARKLNSVTVTMSDWALASTYSSLDPGYNHALTLNLYHYTGESAAGGLIGSTTLNAFIPWRPAADPTCAGGTAWRSPADGNCYNGLAFNVTFDFSALNVILPNDIVFGLAFNTADYGNSPIHAPGPYNSLNYAVVANAPSVGTDVNPDRVFWNTSCASCLTPGGPGTPGVFSADTNWTGFVPAVSFDASVVPEPGSLALVGLALGGVAFARRRRDGV